MQASPGEFSLSKVGDYNMFCKNVDNLVGRGIVLYVLYVDKCMPAVEVCMETKFEENVFVGISLSSSVSLFIGVKYRSDSGPPENNSLLFIRTYFRSE